MATLQSLDIRRRSASTEAPPQIRQQALQVAKLIDVSKCIGCKACQAACLEWNDLKQEIGYTDGTYNNPTDLTPASWTVMRFTEYEHGDDLEWLIRKDGCMHCDDPGCLKACPAPGAIVQYSNGIVDFSRGTGGRSRRRTGGRPSPRAGSARCWMSGSRAWGGRRRRRTSGARGRGRFCTTTCSTRWR
jgi:Fe-S-cluster-containing hydrogenase component 2